MRERQARKMSAFTSDANMASSEIGRVADAVMQTYANGWFWGGRLAANHDLDEAQSSLFVSVS